MYNNFKYILFSCLLALIFLPMWYLPLLQEQFPSLQVEEVVGYFGKKKKPNFYGKRWMSGQYQQQYETFVKTRNVLHPTAIRLKSQIDYSFYGDIMHANILRGKGNFLFQKEGCEAYIGRDYKGVAWIEEKARKLKAIKNELAKDSIPVLVLMPPLKARIYSDYLPDFYRESKTDSTNWNVFSEIFKKHDIDVIDFSFMEKEKSEYQYPLYPPSGQHWTSYGCAIVAETIKSYLEKRLDIEMVEMQWKDSIELSAAKAGYDNELVAGANFIWTPELEPLPYPKIRYIENDSTTKPNVLAVGDSFYKVLFDSGIVDGIFNKNSTLWYYNHEVYPIILRDGRRITNKDIDIIAEIKKRDVLIITVFEDNLDRFAFEFVDNVYRLLF